MSTSNTILASVEGGIGSGKSTLLGYLRQHSTQFVYVDEPLSKWDQFKDASGQTILQKFYADPTKYGFSFQIMALLSRMTAIRTAIKENPGKIIITERCLHTDKLVFARMLNEAKHIEDVNYQIYQSCFNTFITECPVSAIIYVKTEPQTCQNRISKRSRAGEEAIPLEYLQSCDQYHEMMMEELDLPTLILDGNVNIEDEPNLSESWRLQIEAFIQTQQQQTH